MMCARPSPLWPLALVLAAAGCSSELVPVAGRVTLDGQPVANSYVVLYPADGGGASDQVANGRTDAAGVYRLATAGVPGARPGAYRVVVVAQTNEKPPRAKPNPMSIYPAIDRKYFTPDTTPLRMEVTAARPGGYDLAVTR
jgi:hypothetical protein